MSYCEFSSQQWNEFKLYGSARLERTGIRLFVWQLAHQKRKIKMAEVVWPSSSTACEDADSTQCYVMCTFPTLLLLPSFQGLHLCSLGALSKLKKKTTAATRKRVCVMFYVHYLSFVKCLIHLSLIIRFASY